MLDRTLAALAGAFALLAMAAPAAAQSGAPEFPVGPTAANRLDGVENSAPSTRGENSRMRRNQRQAAPAAPTPEQVQAAAQAALQAAGRTTCSVTEAVLLGADAAGAMIYEAACASGPGYIVSTATPPVVADCVVLASQAATTPAAPPATGATAAPQSPRCNLPANADTRAFLAAYAVEAGVTCQVDDGAAIGQNGQNLVYEIGCAGTDGAWIERSAAGWEATPCMILVTQDATCRFTTAEEQAASVETWLAGSPAAACDVARARYMGANANGAYYEAACAAGDGYVARLNTDRVLQQVYPCAEAGRIGGGCTLTQVAAAPAAAAPAQSAPATGT